MPLVRSVRKPLFLPKVAGAAWRNRNAFRDVENYCMFIGHGRSGHSIVGALLNAHPRVVISRELDVLKYLQRGVPIGLIYGAILVADDRFSNRWNSVTGQGHDYKVPGQWQGRFERLQVIGDKRGGRSADRLARSPGVLEKLRRAVRVPLRVIHVVRNPFDNISTISARRHVPLEAAIDHFSAGEGHITLVRPMLGSEELLTIRHEDLLDNPQPHLSNIFAWLGAPATPEFLRDASSILFSSPKKTRLEAPWTPILVDRVNELIRGKAWLAGYSFEG
ncbi:MAG: sulfotransferase [Actinomycetota bacterium]